MTRSIRLRPWQKRALERLADAAGPDFLAVATPGAGKTTFALTAVRGQLAQRPGARLVVVAPTQHLKLQWADAAARFELYLEPSWRAADGLPHDLHGVVVTYQQVAQNPRALAPLARDGVVVLDEVHHAADERAWGEGVRIAFEGAARRLSLSGTPFRSDTVAIPFVRYRLDEATPDFEYGYADALADGRVVRPVFFPHQNGHMEWSAPDGTLHSHSFDDPLDRARANERLRTALSLEGEWLPAVLRQANERLQLLRRVHPDAGGLVIAMDQDHARGIAELLRVRFGVVAAVATSDDANASDRIAAFAASRTPWLVAVRMVSEGVDIPRLRVGVFATNTTTELFFRQAVGRLVRWTSGAGRQPAFLFIPDDRRLRTWASQIADQRRHSLRRPSEDAAPAEAAAGAEIAFDQAPAERLSLFEALSAVPIESAEPPPWERWDDPLALGVGEAEAGGPGGDGADGADGVEVELGPPPPLPSRRPPARLARADASPRAQRKALRDANTELAGELARLTGWPHARVNAELNRLTGVRRITEATLAQLDARRAHGERWLARERRSRGAASPRTPR
ncbi:MAG: DEAD/DEAH box helicase [Acidimicrobiales bacterium]